MKDYYVKIEGATGEEFYDRVLAPIREAIRQKLEADGYVFDFDLAVTAIPKGRI